MKLKTSPEQTKLWVLPRLGNLELLHATYVTQSFSRHTHEGYALGVIEKGALKFFYRGENLVAPSGFINLANPGEAHDGSAAIRTGWTYRMFYLDHSLLQHAASEIAGRPKGLPFFQTGIIRDPQLAKLIFHLHMALEKLETPLLEQESRLLWMLAQFVTRHADENFVLRPAGRENQAVKRVREYIESYYSDDISIQKLSSVANLSPFHLIRVFRKEVGIPPHTYLNQVRVTRAKDLLAKGWPAARVSFETGFVDQSHLTRQFKRIAGVTPGQYSKIVQDLPV